MLERQIALLEPRVQRLAQAVEDILVVNDADLDDVERKRHHYEVDARNRFGEKVEVHIDFAGNIYREKRD